MLVNCRRQSLDPIAARTPLVTIPQILLIRRPRCPSVGRVAARGRGPRRWCHGRDSLMPVAMGGEEKIDT